MATQEFGISEPSDRTQPLKGSDDQHDIAPVDHAFVQTDDKIPNLATGLSTEASSLRTESQAETLSDADRDISLEDATSVLKHENSRTERGIVISPISQLSTPLAEGDTSIPPGFAFSRLDRSNLELGSRRKDLQRISQRNDSSPEKPSSASDGAHVTKAAEVTRTSPPATTASAENAYKLPTEGTPHESDVATGGYSELVEPRSDGSVQHQLDQRIYHEASMSDDIERQTSPSTSEGVIYIGARRSGYPAPAVSGSRSAETRSQVTQPLARMSRQANGMSPTASSSNCANRESSQAPLAPISARGASVEVTRHRPIPSPRFPTPRNARVSASTQGGIQELLEVVEYKFKQNEQQLRQAFFADSNKVQRELKQAYEENEDLQSQVAALEDRCNISEAAIVKYRAQIGKAKGLQRFLDGLGSDLHSLKRSNDAEKSSFAERIKASENEISRLKSTLAGKDEYERMLSHSKTSLEKLLEARNFELQSLVQHRDMLRTQLDERVGQLVEERDTRLRLEQLVAELRISERTSVTTSIEQCAASLVSRFGDICRQDDCIIVGIAELQDAIKLLTERQAGTPDECEAIRFEIRELGMRVLQSLGIEATTNTTVAEVSSAVEGIVQSHVQKLCRSLDRLESVSRQTTDDVSAQVILRQELQGSADRLRRAESQLESEKQSKTSLEKSLDRSVARIPELEAASNAAAVTNTDVATPQDVENKVSCIGAYHFHAPY